MDRGRRAPGEIGWGQEAAVGGGRGEETLSRAPRGAWETLPPSAPGGRGRAARPTPERRGDYPLWGLGALVRWETPWVARFAATYQELRALPRWVRRVLQRKLALSLAEVALLLALGQGGGQAATITVTVGGMKPCTLVDAITAANTDTAIGGCPAGSGADTIVFPTGTGSTQTLTTVNNTSYGGARGLPVVTSTITLAGRGGTLARGNSAPAFGLLAVGPGGNLTVQDLTLRGGTTTYSGGVENRGTLTLLRSTVSGNTASQGGGGVGNNHGTLTVTNSTVSGNTAGYAGGGVDNYVGTLILTNSTVSGNTAGTGGGVRNHQGTVTITNSTLTGNSVSFGGGGVNNRYGTATVTFSILSGNTASVGGGVENFSGTFILTSSLLSGNTAADVGGGVRNVSVNNIAAILTVTQSTLSGNTARYGGSVFNRYGTVTLANSLISGNGASDNGGGVYNGFGSTVTMTQSTLSSNTAAHDAGGVRNSGTFVLTGSTLEQNVAANVAGGIDNGGTFTITQSTLSGNTATYGGGGVFNSGSLVLTQSTLSGNVSGGVYNGGPGSTLTLARTLVSGNTGGVGREIKNLTSVTADNFNLFGHDGDAGVDGFTPVASEVPSVPLSRILSPALAFNGGPTQTQALALVSGNPVNPAVNAVTPGGCPATDQRGFVRNVGACDIGAFELGASAPQTVVNKLVSFVPRPDTFSTTTNTTGCPVEPTPFVGKFFFQARLTNTSGSPSLTALKASVRTLSNTNKLQTADGGPGGVGAQQTLPQASALALAQTLDVPFVICLKNLNKFQFIVNVSGLTQ